MLKTSFVFYLITSSINGGMEWGEKNAIALFSSYYGFLHCFALFGGFFTDKFLGNKNGLIIGIIFYALGYFLLGFQLLHLNMMLVGLFMIILGYGFFKPAISSLVGYSYSFVDKSSERGFSLSYLCSICGNVFGGIFAGLIVKYLGFKYVLIIGGVIFCIGFLMIILLKNVKDMTLNVLKKNCRENFLEDVCDKDRFFTILFLMLFSIFHYGTHIMCNSLCVTHITNNVDRHFFGWEIPVPWFSTFHLPFQIFIITLMPLLWSSLNKLLGSFSIVKKLFIGCISSVTAFLLLAITTKVSELEIGKQSLTIFLPYYSLSMIFFVFSSVCVNSILWSMMFELAPNSYKNFFMALLMLSLSCGGILSGYVLTLINSFRVDKIFFIMGVLLLSVAIITLLFEYLFIGKNCQYLENRSAEKG